MDHEKEASAEERLQQLESQIHALMGHVKAFEYGLRLLIATHPKPDVVLQALDQITGQALSPSPTSEDAAEPLYQAALSQGLRIMREQVAEAAKSSP